MSGRRSRLPRFVVCASVSGSPFYDELSNYQGRVLCVAFGRWLIQIDIARCKP